MTAPPRVRLGLLETWALRAYQAAGAVLVPLAILLLLPVLLVIRKRRRTLPGRLGFQPYPDRDPAPPPPLWIHALSVGELLSASRLIELVRPRLGARKLYLSVSTLSGRETARDRLAEHVDGLFYFPYDVVFAVRRCCGGIGPGLFVLVESDLWPAAMAEMRRRGVPCLLLNGRLSPRSFAFYRRFGLLFRPVLNSFARVYPQSAREAERFVALGLDPRRIARAGNLKFDAAGEPPGDPQLAELRRELRLEAGVPVVIAGSTHAGEEAVLRSVFERLRTRFEALRLIVVPRRPQRAGEVRALFDGDPQVFVVDRMGVLGRLYALADVAFVGGSLVSRGGQNPIEPAVCGKPVLFGPDMRDFPDVSRMLLEAQGAIQVRDEADLLDRLDALLGDPAEAQRMGRNARRIVDDNRGITQAIADEIGAML